MPLVLADRVKETTTSTGTGTITLAGTVAGFQSFSVIGDGNTTYYTIAGQGNSEWEVGIGTYTVSGTTLSRDTVLASSAGAPTKTNFSAGTKDVFVTYTAARSVNVNGSSIDTFGLGAVQGDLLYAASANNFVLLPKSATATRYLANTGTTNNPQWDQINLANGVTGTLPIANGGTGNTSGDATTLNSISAVNLYNNMGNVHGFRTSFDATTPSYGFGYRYVQGSANGPGTGGSQYYSWYIGLGSDYLATGAGSYGAMFAVDRNIASPTLSVRFNENNSFGPWRSLGVPSGTIIWFAANSAPPGYLAANGASVSTSTYAALFAAIGYTFGGSGGAFNVPDLRGYFVRGVDNGRGVDSGRGFGTNQSDAFQGHFHGWRRFPANGGGSGNTPLAQAGGTIINTIVTSPVTDGVNGTPRTAAETRPTNIALLGCIKF